MEKVLKKKELYHYTNVTMTDEELKKLPATALSLLIEARKKINIIFTDNSDLLIEGHTDGFVYVLSEDARFKFSISLVVLNPNGKLTCQISKLPTSISDIQRSTFNALVAKCPEYFNEWVEMIKIYNNTLNEFYDPFYSEFEKEFENEFKINEDDDSSPLKSDEQLKVYKLLESIELILEEEDQTNAEIQKLLAYNEDFKENLHTLPKSAIKKKAIHLLSKMRKLGIKLFYKALDVGFKEAIKLALDSGMDGIHHLLK